MALPQETVDELTKKHGEISVIRYLDRDVVLRKPTAAEYKRFRAISFNEKKRDVALETITRDTMVHPSGAEVDALFERYPAVGEAVGPEALRMVGLVEADIKK